MHIQHSRLNKHTQFAKKIKKHYKKYDPNIFWTYTTNNSFVNPDRSNIFFANMENKVMKMYVLFMWIFITLTNLWKIMLYWNVFVEIFCYNLLQLMTKARNRLQNCMSFSLNKSKNFVWISIAMFTRIHRFVHKIKYWIKTEETEKISSLTVIMQFEKLHIMVMGD